MKEFFEKLEHSLTSFDTGLDELNDYLHKFVSTGGKRVRAKLGFYLIQSHNEKISDTQIELLSAGELMHSASLIHDDIIDSANTRRELTTLHNIYDSKLAVIAGDFLASIALNKILALNNTQISTLFLNTFQNMCIAEFKQYFEKGSIPELNSYLKKNEEKTANLFASILEGCAILSKNIPLENSKQLGLAYGRAFQLKNDLSDFSKNNSTDQNNKTFTAPNIFLSKGVTEKIAIEKTINLIDNEKKVMRSLIKSIPHNEYKTELINMIEEL